MNSVVNENTDSIFNKIFNNIFKYDKYFFALAFVFISVLIILNIDISFAVAILLLIINLYLVFKFHKNIHLFFCMLSIFYFNYSFIISKYISSTNTINVLYRQVRFGDTMMIGLYCVFMFLCIIGFFLGGNNIGEQIDTSKLKKKYSKKYTWFAGCGIILIITAFIVLAYLLRLDYLKALYEYSLILFIIGFLLCKDNKVLTILLTILMIVSMVLNIYDGGRIISLLPGIAFFFIFLAKYSDYKDILVVMLLGAILYTFFGLYGDIKDSDKDFSRLTASYLVDTIDDRKFTLDTSISAYWTGLTFIELTNYETPAEGINNFVEYVFVYTPLGNKFSNYEHVYYKSIKKYVHSYGGYLTSYFYYWLGYAGVILIGCYVGSLLNILRNNDDQKRMYDFKLILSVYLIATLPRWYLYYPSTLFRGMILLIICYFVFDKVSCLRCFHEKK